MIKLIKNINQSISLTRYYRIQNYLDDMEKHITIKSKKDKERIKEIKPMIKIIIKKLKRITTIELLIYFIIYFSFISFIFADMLFLSDIAKYISKLLSLFGTTIFFILLYLSNKAKNLYYQDLTLLAAHLISIYSKHENVNLEEQEDKKDVFIEFFKTRGF